MEYRISLNSLKNTLKVKERDYSIDKKESNFKKFTLKDGREFFYCNWDNAIYDSDKNLLSAKQEVTQEYRDIIKEVRTIHKKNNPMWLRILMGHACNYSCAYCMQKDIGNPDEREKIKTTDKLIDQIKRNIDFSRIQKIDLWGGETLLYWKTMTELMSEFDREGLTWFIPTNGTPLMMKHIEFFKTLKGNVTLGISHDGPAHERLRGKEFLYNKIEVLKALQENNIQFSFNPVISNTNFNLYDINKFFYDFCEQSGLDVNKTGLTWVIGHNYGDGDGNSSSHVVSGDNLKQFSTIIKSFIDDCIDQKFNGVNNRLLNNSLIDSDLGVINYAKLLRNQILPTYVTSCGADDAGVLTLDMNGNIRTCPHTDETHISGHVENIEKAALTKIDINRYDSHCNSCEVFRLCKSNCPIETTDEVFYTNCAIEKVYNKAIQNKSFSLIFKSDVV